MFREVLVANDGSPRDGKALEAAIELAKGISAQLPMGDRRRASAVPREHRRNRGRKELSGPSVSGGSTCSLWVLWATHSFMSGLLAARPIVS